MSIRQPLVRRAAGADELRGGKARSTTEARRHGEGEDGATGRRNGLSVAATHHGGEREAARSAVAAHACVKKGENRCSVTYRRVPWASGRHLSRGWSWRRAPAMVEWIWNWRGRAVW